MNQSLLEAIELLSIMWLECIQQCKNICPYHVYNTSHMLQFVRPLISNHHYLYSPVSNVARWTTLYNRMIRRFHLTPSQDNCAEEQAALVISVTSSGSADIGLSEYSELCCQHFKCVPIKLHALDKP